MSRLDKTLYYARKQVEHSGVYVWSGQGQKLAKMTLIELAAMENSAENAGRVERFVYNHWKQFDKHTKVFDCSGLICCALIYGGVLPKNSDFTAQGLFNTFRNVSINNRKAGDLIFKESSGAITHVGIVKDLATVIECKGREYGVVESVIDGSWTKAARPEY